MNGSAAASLALDGPPCVFRECLPGVPPDVRSFIHVAPSAMTLADGPLPARTRAFEGGVRPLPSAAVICTNQFKNGTHIEIDGTIYRIIEFQHVKPGQGRGVRAHEAAQDRRRQRHRQDLPGGGEVPAGSHRDAEDAVPLRLRRSGRVHGQLRLRAARDRDARRRRRGDAVGAAQRRGRGALRRRAARRRPGAERGRDGGHGDRARASRATPPRAAAPSRRRWSRACGSRCRCSSTRAIASGSTPAPASTSRAPEGGPAVMRRSDQRRDAVFALYQRGCDRPAARRAARRRRRRSRRELAEGVEAHREELDAEIARARSRLGPRPDRAARDEHHAGGPVRDRHRDDVPTRSRSTRRSSSPRSTAARTRPASSTASSAPPRERRPGEPGRDAVPFPRDEFNRPDSRASARDRRRACATPRWRTRRPRRSPARRPTWWARRARRSRRICAPPARKTRS